MRLAPVVRPNRKLEQAAFMSNPKALAAPILCWMRATVLGKNMSGVTVQQTMASSSSASMPRRSRAIRRARTPMSEEAIPGSTHRRVRMPVRVKIHSSLVSTILARSSLVTTRSG
jgi:hypothetical protein